MARTRYTSKINKVRSFALGLVFAGFIIMYLGIFFRTSPLFMTIFITAGVLAILGSTVIYFWIDLLSSKAVQVVCPSCQKYTKMLGRVDICMYCREPLTTDLQLAGKEFDEKYNKNEK